MYQKLNNEPLTIYGDGEQSRAFSYIDDTLPCIWKAATLKEASRQIVNLGGKKRYTINDACKVIQEVFGETEVVHLEERYEVRHAIPTFAKSVLLLGYDEKTSLKEGLEKMWAWAQVQPKRERFKWPFYEIDKGMYSYWK
jgi:UDP-glucose 4-epimerase